MLASHPSLHLAGSDQVRFIVTLSDQRVAVAGLPRLESPLVVMMSASAIIALAKRISLSGTLYRILVVPGWLSGWLFTAMSVVVGRAGAPHLGLGHVLRANDPSS